MNEQQQAEVRAALKCTADAIWEELDSEYPTELFHYTSEDGFRGILGSRELWCTKPCCLDDKQEGDHAMKVIREVVRGKREVVQGKSVPRAVKQMISLVSFGPI